MNKDSIIEKEDSSPKFYCPKCKAEITNPVIWGQGWEQDDGDCESCGYSGLLDTMTGHDPDGSVWQVNLEDDEEEETYATCEKCRWFDSCEKAPHRDKGCPYEKEEPLVLGDEWV